jgi:hypothetical protein
MPLPPPGTIVFPTGTFPLSGVNYLGNSCSSPPFRTLTCNKAVLLTSYRVILTNTIGGPPIPTGTSVFEQTGTGTNPIVNINQKVGPSNTYVDPVGITAVKTGTDGKPIIVSSSQAISNSWTNSPNLPFPNSISGRSITAVQSIFITGTNRGTMTRTVTFTAPSGTNPGTIEITTP